LSGPIVTAVITPVVATPLGTAVEGSTDSVPVTSLSPLPTIAGGGTIQDIDGMPNNPSDAGKVGLDVSGATCFPGSATAELADGKRVMVKDVWIGDKLCVSFAEFSEVFMQTYGDAGYEGNVFVQVFTEGGFSITATTGHMVHICKLYGNECRRKIIRIEDAVQRPRVIMPGPDGEKHVQVIKVKQVSRK